MFALSSIPTATRVSSARPSVSSRSRARAVTTRASNADHHRDVPVVSRRALSLSASTLAVLGAVALVEPRPSDAAYGSASGGGGGEDATEGTWDTFYGAADPPATYGALGGTKKSLAKYSYDVASSWVEEATSKVEKGSGGQDSRWVKKGSRGEVKAYCLTLNRAGQDGASFALTDSSLQAVAGALSEMQDSISNGRVKSSRITENDKDYAVFDVDADRKYTVKITIDNTGRLFAFVVTAPASKWRSEKAVLDRMVSSFAVYTNASQFV